MPAVKRAKISDVAEVVGVSRSTVSVALSGQKWVNPALKERILQAARKLNYRPNANAQALARGRTKKIGMLVRHLYSQFTPLAVQAVEEAAATRGYRISLGITGQDDEKIHSHLENFSHGQADGLLILTNAVSFDQIVSLADRGYPVSLFGMKIPHREDLTLVTLDETTAFRQLLDYLYSMGHREYGMLWELRSGTPHMVEVLNKFCFERHLRMDESRQVDEVVSFDDAEVAAGAFLDRHPEVTALICQADTFAIGAINAASKRNQRVPEDLSVIGHDDFPVGRHYRPPLTTIHFPFADVAKGLVDGIVDWIEGKERRRPVRISTELIVRQSSGPARTVGR
ncbi:MAG: LacI family DNA-binding transcriptional regulator [Phycisphaerae bacterium]|nr:LacI family DNA-binding transcriptional regulator [Phycisphaerae bacterium]